MSDLNVTGVNPQPAVPGGAASRDVWSDIGNFFGNVTGVNASNMAAQSQKQAQSQLALQNQYGANAAGVYGNLNQQGNAQEGAYGNQYLNLLNRFESLAGLGGNALNINARQPSATGGNLASQLNAVPGSGPSDAPAGENPYQLDQNQQGLLNQRMGLLSQTHQQAVSQLQQQFQARGITDPRAQQVGVEKLNEHFAALAQDEQTQFYNQIKDDKLKNLQTLLSGLEGYGKTGIAQQEAAGSGYLGLATGAQNAAAQQQNQAFQQQNLSNEQSSGLFHLLTQFFPGGSLAGGASTAAIGGGNTPFASDTAGLVA